MVFSRLDEDTLGAVPKPGGGNFIRLEGSTNAASQFAEELASLQKSAVGSETEATKIGAVPDFRARRYPSYDCRRVNLGQATNHQSHKSREGVMNLRMAAPLASIFVTLLALAACGREGPRQYAKETRRLNRSSTNRHRKL